MIVLFLFQFFIVDVSLYQCIFIYSVKKKYLVWKVDHFCSSVVDVFPCSGCFITCMGAHFPAVELDNAIQFSILSRMSGFLWHSFKWACRVGRFLQYTSRLEMLTCSLDTNISYVTTMLQLRLSLNHKVKLQYLLGERCGNFLGVLSKIDM